ncbi:MAG: hypothetical protein FWG51_01525 [Firmicutes bacterium]|nr:hypothetical protein [Bacillota bacterium]
MYLVELSDNRNKILYEKLKKLYKTQSYNEENSLISKDACVIFSPAKKLKTEDIEKLPKGIKVIGGNQKSDVLKIFETLEIKYINILSDEIFTVKNAVLTAECTLRVLIDATEKSIFENNILILGCGRIGKALSLLLSKLGLNFSVCSHSKAGFETTPLYCKRSYFGVDFIHEVSQFDVIINTAPALILKDDGLLKIAPNTSIIELASVPCLDIEKLKGLSIKYIKALGIPSLYCPETAADLMFESIINYKE